MSKYNTAPKVADYLLQIKAILLEPANTFGCVSGWFSSLYCDNRNVLSYPNIRKFIREAPTGEIKSDFYPARAPAPLYNMGMNGRSGFADEREINTGAEINTGIMYRHW